MQYNLATYRFSDASETTGTDETKAERDLSGIYVGTDPDGEDFIEEVASAVSSYISLEGYEVTYFGYIDNVGTNIQWTKLLNGIETYDCVFVSVSADDGAIRGITFPNAGILTDEVIASTEYIPPEIDEEKAIELYEEFCSENNANTVKCQVDNIWLKYDTDWDLVWIIEGAAGISVISSEGTDSEEVDYYYTGMLVSIDAYTGEVTLDE